MEDQETPQWKDVEPKAPAIVPKNQAIKEAINTQMVLREQSAPTLKTRSDGIIDTSSIDGQKLFATRMIQEGLISDTFKTAQQVMLGMQYCKELGLEMLTGLRMMYVVRGRPCLWGEGPLSLCLRSGQVTFIREFFINEKGDEICFANKNLKDKVYGSVTQLSRVGDDSIQEDYFTVDDMKRAKLDFSKNGKKETWEKFERNMMRYKARTMAIRTKFADMFSGVTVAEYHEHFDPSNPEVLPAQKTLAKEIGQYAEDETSKESETTR